MFDMIVDRLTGKTPVVGARYPIRGTKDPWGKCSRTVAEVTDIRDGWVRYRFFWDDMANSDVEGKHAVKIGSFVDMYDVRRPL